MNVPVGNNGVFGPALSSLVALKNSSLGVAGHALGPRPQPAPTAVGQPSGGVDHRARFSLGMNDRCSWGPSIFLSQTCSMGLEPATS